METYRFTTCVILRNVTIFVQADSIEEARTKAKQGDWSDDETANSQVIDWAIESEGELNK